MKILTIDEGVDEVPAARFEKLRERRDEKGLLNVEDEDFCGISGEEWGAEGERGWNRAESKGLLATETQSDVRQKRGTPMDQKTQRPLLDASNGRTSTAINLPDDLPRLMSAGVRLARNPPSPPPSSPSSRLCFVSRMKGKRTTLHRRESLSSFVFFSFSLSRCAIKKEFSPLSEPIHRPF